MTEKKKPAQKQTKLRVQNRSESSVAGWTCSECKTVIAIPGGNMSEEERERIIAERFAKHVAESHKKQPPKKKPAPKEDFSQAAVRIVREATKD